MPVGGDVERSAGVAAVGVHVDVAVDDQQVDPVDSREDGKDRGQFLAKNSPGKIQRTHVCMWSTSARSRHPAVSP